MASLDSCVVDWEGAVEDAESAGAFLDCRDGAHDDELVLVEAGTSVVVYEDVFRWGKKTAFAAPNLVKNWRYNTVVHVASESKIELFDFFFDGFVKHVNRGVNEQDFGLFLRELLSEFG